MFPYIITAHAYLQYCNLFYHFEHSCSSFSWNFNGFVQGYGKTKSQKKVIKNVCIVFTFFFLSFFHFFFRSFSLSFGPIINYLSEFWKFLHSRQLPREVRFPALQLGTGAHLSLFIYVSMQSFVKSESIYEMGKVG